MAVTGLQSLVDSLADLTGGGLPGTKAQLAVIDALVSHPVITTAHWSSRRRVIVKLEHVRDLSTGVESDLLAERHGWEYGDGVEIERS